MCGIIYAERKDGKDVGRTVSKRYHKQSGRGTQGFGFVATDRDGNITRIERSMTEKEILERLQNGIADNMLFHHRFPTSTANIPSATHPIFVSSEMLQYDYYVIHNGVISNPSALKLEHEKMGFEYTTEIKKRTVYTQKDGNEFYVKGVSEFNDSEAFAIEFALYIEGKRENLEGATGSIAFIALRSNKEGIVNRVYYGHNDGNPLVLEETNEIFCLKSEGHGEKLPVDTLFWRDVPSGETGSVPLNIGGYKLRKVGFSAGEPNWQRLGYGTAYDNDYDSGWRYDEERGVYKDDIDESIRETYEHELDEEIEQLEFDLDCVDIEMEEIREQIKARKAQGKETWLLEEELKECAKEHCKISNDIAMKKIDRAYGL